MGAFVVTQPMKPAEKVAILRHTLTALEMDMAKLGIFSPDPVRAKLQVHFLDNIGLVQVGEEDVATPAPVKREPRGKRPKSGKVMLTLRLDPTVIDAYKATGKGWQTRMNETLAANLPA